MQFLPSIDGLYILAIFCSGCYQVFLSMFSASFRSSCGAGLVLTKISQHLFVCIDVLQGLGQSFDLTWRGIMLLLNQTLTPNERSAAITALREFGDLWYLSQVNDRMTTEERE